MGLFWKFQNLTLPTVALPSELKGCSPQLREKVCRNTPNYGMIFQGTNPWLRKLGLAVTYARDGHQQQYERRRVITTKVITSSYHL